MTDLSTDLAALRIPQDQRGGGRRPIVVLVVVLVIAFVAVGAWLWSTRLQAASVRVATVVPKPGAASGNDAVLNASGYVTARREATVSAKVTGKVVDVLIDEGHAVKEGQILARLDDTQARASLQYAQAQLEAAKRSEGEDEARLREAGLTLQRDQQLVKQQVVGQAELDSAQASVDALEARIAYGEQQIAVAGSQVKLQQANLDDMVVRAPFSGVAISKDAQPGEMVSPMSAGGGFTRTGICTIVDMSSLEIEVDVNEAYINRVQTGQRVEAVLDAYPDWRIPAHVITTIPTADRQKATVKVRVGFEHLDPRILPDMGVKVSFLRDDAGRGQADAAARRMLVPKTAVRSDNGQSVVFVLRDNRAERRAIGVGMETGDAIEVTSGLASGEKVIVDGPQTLKDGDKVKVQ
jgi:HlyD family secretion protein